MYSLTNLNLQVPKATFEVLKSPSLKAIHAHESDCFIHLLLFNSVFPKENI